MEVSYSNLSTVRPMTAHEPSLALAAGSRPTIFEIWAPSCAQCIAMQTDVDEVTEVFSDRMDLRMINAVEALEVTRSLGVRATPTLIGVSEGREVVRLVGRRSRADLYELFEAVAEGGPIRGVSRQDRTLRLVAGSALVGVGLATGPAWPLVILGSGLLVYGLRR